MEIHSFIEETNAAQSIEEVLHCFSAAIACRGFAHFALAEIRPTPDSPAQRYTPVAIQYPQEWVDHYLSQGYASVDPVVVQMPTRRRAHWWAEFEMVEEQGRRMMRDAVDAGLLIGAAVPVHGPFGQALVAGFATDQRDLQPEVLSELTLLTTQLNLCYSALAHPVESRPVQLTERELECLRWSACGKSSSDIAGILNISENTVNFHMKNAILKLSACNRIMAIVRAIRMGLIAP